MATNISINTCQKICLQITATSSATPYTWTAANSNVLVTSGGNGFSGIVGGSTAGSSGVLVKDANGGLIAYFAFTVASLSAYVPPGGSNTSLFASTVLSTSATGTQTTITFTGTFFNGSFSTNNYIWIAFQNSTTAPADTGFSVTNNTWNRSSTTMVFNKPSITATRTVSYALAGIGVTSPTPSDSTQDYAVPIVGYFPTTSQTAAASTTITLPISMPCADVTKYVVFAQTGSSGLVQTQVATLLNSNTLKVGYNVNNATSASFSYMIVAKGLSSSTAINYSDLFPVSIVNGTSSQTFTIPSTVPVSSLFYAMLQPTTISDTVSANTYVINIFYTGGATNNLTVTFQNLSGGTVATNLGFFALKNQVTGGITLSIP